VVVRPELIRVIVLVATDGTGGAAELPGAEDELESKAVDAPLSVNTGKLGEAEGAAELSGAVNELESEAVDAPLGIGTDKLGGAEEREPLVITLDREETNGGRTSRYGTCACIQKRRGHRCKSA
jgi:hypothetical protein